MVGQLLEMVKLIKNHPGEEAKAKTGTNTHKNTHKTHKQHNTPQKTPKQTNFTR